MSEQESSRKGNDQLEEPSLKRILARLGRHGLLIAFFGLLEAGITLLLRWLGQERLIWARVVQAVAVFCFSASFVIQAGSELVRDFLEAIVLVRERLRRF